MTRSGWFGILAAVVWSGLVPGCQTFGLRSSTSGADEKKQATGPSGKERDPGILAPVGNDDRFPNGGQPTQTIDVVLPNYKQIPGLGQDPPSEPAPPLLPERPRTVVQAQPVAQPVDPATKPDPVVILAMRKLIERRPAEAEELLDCYGPPNQESLWRLLNIAYRLHEKGLAGLNPEELCAIQKSLRYLDLVVRSRAPLHIDRMFFCESGRASGDVRPLKAGHVFRAGQGNLPGELVQIHVDFRNLSCVKRGDMFETVLLCSAEISDPSGKSGPIVWKKDLDKGKVTLRSPTERTEYSTYYTFYLPPLPAGNLVLTLTLQDWTRPEQVRIVRRSLEFCVNNQSESTQPAP